MKGIKFFLILITIALLLISCKKEKNDEIVTYHFTSDDSIKLLPHYVNGKIFTFVNSEGDERKFEIINIEQKYSQLSQLGGGIFSPSRYYYYFYYEEKIISLKDYKNEKIYCINIWRYPIDVESAKVDIYKKFANRLNMELTSHQDGNYSGSGYYQMSFYYGTPVITLLSNGLTFDKVHILDREIKIGMGFDTSYWEHLGGTFNEAKYTYYDENYGIVGFDSYDGCQWRLKNQ